MYNKIIQTSILALLVVTPALSETFPTDGYMQENKTYIDAATYENLGVYSGTITAEAKYSDILFTIAAGRYLAKASEATEGTLCPEGSYCSGLSNATYSETIDQGKTTCPNGYTNSAAGATSINECYTSCTVANANIAHASAVKGNDYYGTGTDTCEPTACENGWHVKAGSVDLQTIIGTDAGVNNGYAYINNGGTFKDPLSQGQNYYGITSKNEFAVDYGTKGIVTGLGRCSTQSGTNNDWAWTDPTIKTTLADETGTGQYCYCQVTGYTPVGDTKQSLYSAWIFLRNNNSTDECASYCARRCASTVQSDNASYLAFRSALFGTIDASSASCEANTITINWTDVADASETTSTTVYEGNIKTPTSATTKPGKRFIGWKFSPQN